MELRIANGIYGGHDFLVADQGFKFIPIAQGILFIPIAQGIFPFTKDKKTYGPC
jgi:hypothetical protein